MINYYFISTIIFHIYLLTVILNNPQKYDSIIYNTLFLNLLSLIITSFLKLKLKTKQPFLKISDNYCNTCNIFKNEFITHCFHCKMCILIKDHHCVWLNNCISDSNRVWYIIYLFTTAFIISYVIFFIEELGFVFYILLLILIFIVLQSCFSILLFGFGLTSREFFKMYFNRKYKVESQKDILIDI